MVKGRQLPQPFLDKLRRLIPVNQWDKVLKTFSQERPTTFRANTLKTEGPSLRRELEGEGLKVENVLWNRDAFILRKGTQKDLERTPAYKEGKLYVQGLSSMVPPLVLAPGPGEKVLDLTAAPGSKTTQMAALMRNEGSLVANDGDRIRVQKLKANLALQGATCAGVLEPGDGGLVWKGHFEGFDKVLLDAPCSSEGRFQLDTPSTYGYWREDTNRKMAKDQRRLFKSAFLCLKPGGTMVYSTCTFAPEENEGVLQWACGTYGDALEVETVTRGLPAHTRGLAGWGDLKFSEGVPRSIRVLPTPEVEGFFVARLRKTHSVEPPKNEWSTQG
jgi:NOL1/NOP2/sun family putative RNA methylase